MFFDCLRDVIPGTDFSDREFSSLMVLSGFQTLNILTVGRYFDLPLITNSEDNDWIVLLLRIF